MSEIKQKYSSGEKLKVAAEAMIGHLTQNEITIIEGRADIITPKNIENIDLYLILQEDTISIILQPKILGNDYNGQPIYGLTNYMTK